MCTSISTDWMHSHKAVYLHHDKNDVGEQKSICKITEVNRNQRLRETQRGMSTSLLSNFQVCCSPFAVVLHMFLTKMA